MKPKLLIPLFVLALLPFLQRPWLFDDPSVILAARAAAADPLRPYSYRMDLAWPQEENWQEGKGPAYTHPPISAWVLGAVIHVFGESEAPLHVAVWLVVLMILWTSQKIARTVIPDSRDAPWLFAFSPVIFLCAQTLYPHVFYLLFYLLAIALAIGTFGDLHRLKVQIGLGVALLLAALSLDHWPVLVGLIVILVARTPTFQWSRLKTLCVPLSFFLVFCSLWQWWEYHVYGSSHFWANFGLRSGVSYAWRGLFLPAEFLAGGLPFIAIAWPYLWRRSRPIFSALVVSVAALALLFAGPRGGFTPGQSLLMAVEVSTALAFFVSLFFFWRAKARAWDQTLILWFGIEFVFVQRFLIYPSGHHLLMLALGAAMITERMMTQIQWPVRARTALWATMALLTLSLAAADYEEAALGPRLQKEVAHEVGPRYYWGNDFSGFSYYLKAAGWQALDVRRTPDRGDVLVVPRNLNVHSIPRFLANGPWKLREMKTYQMRLPWRTLSIGDSAGWYSASWGALPYSLSTQPAETFYIYVVP